MSWSKLPWAIIGAAGIGGAAPNIIDLASTLVGPPPVSVPLWPFYVGVALFFGMGAAVAAIFHESDTRKAFFLGVSLPALIAAAQANQGNNTQLAHLGDSFVSPAFAQSVGSSSVITGRKFGAPSSSGVVGRQPSGVPLTEPGSGPDMTSGQLVGDQTAFRVKEVFKKLLVIGPNQNADPFAVYFYDKNRNLLGNTQITDPSKPQHIIVPGGAATYGFDSKNANASIQPVPEQDVWGVEVNQKRNLWNDFRRGLGNYSIEPYDFSVQSKRSVVDKYLAEEWAR